jgi:hypothetical protein
MLLPLTYTQGDLDSLNWDFKKAMGMAAFHLDEEPYSNCEELPAWRDIAGWRIQQLQEQLEIIRLQLANTTTL